MENKLLTFELIDRISIMVSNARTIPLSGKIMLEKEELLSMIQALSDNLSADMKKAQQLLAMEEKILTESNKQAEATLREANATARATIDGANNKAQAAASDSQARAAETIRQANEQANATVADAQARSQAMLADAQARAQQMVSDSEIVARAQAEAGEMIEDAHRKCDEYAAGMNNAVAQALDHADMALSQQLDQLRALRQGMTNR